MKRRMMCFGLGVAVVILGITDPCRARLIATFSADDPMGTAVISDPEAFARVLRHGTHGAGMIPLRPNADRPKRGMSPDTIDHVLVSYKSGNVVATRARIPGRGAVCWGSGFVAALAEDLVLQRTQPTDVAGLDLVPIHASLTGAVLAVRVTPDGKYAVVFGYAETILVDLVAGTEIVHSHSAVPRLIYSAEAGLLVMLERPYPTGPFRIHVIGVDGQTRYVGAWEAEAPTGENVLANRGTHVLIRRGHGLDVTMESIHIESGSVTQLPLPAGRVTLAPDGTSLVLAQWRQAQRDVALSSECVFGWYVLDTAGEELRPSLQWERHFADTYPSSSAISPSGGRVAFQTQTSGSPQALSLHVLNAQGEEELLFEHEPSFIPTGVEFIGENVILEGAETGGSGNWVDPSSGVLLHAVE